MSLLIENAKRTLKEAGYFTDNLWSVRDVRELYPDASDDFCHRILNEALTDPYVMEVVWYKLKHISQKVQSRDEYLLQNNSHE